MLTVHADTTAQLAAALGIENFKRPEHDINIWIANLEAYSNGDLRGEWLALPADEDEIDALMKRIGCGTSESEYAIFDYDDYTGLNLFKLCGEWASIERLNEMAELWESPCLETDKLAEIAQVEANDLDELIELAERLDDYIYIPAENEEELGRYHVEELQAIQAAPEVMDYFDYEAYGRDLAHEYTATKHGYYITY